MATKRAFVPVTLAAVLTTGCGDSTTEIGDAALDAAHRDATPGDRPLEDVRCPDAAADTGQDANSSDASWDAALQDGAALDGTMADAATACQGVGGSCTGVPWEICPVGTEPANGDPLGCSGHCCVAAPDTSCTRDPVANCLPGRCTGCWADYPDGACEAGRTCCTWICD